jgi:hypothetical protein
MEKAESRNLESGKLKTKTESGNWENRNEQRRIIGGI